MANILGEDKSTPRGDAAEKIAEDEACERAPAVQSADSLVLALEYFRAGRHRAAEEIYGNVLALEPEHFVCLHHLGLIAHHRGDHQGAAALVSRAIAAKPDYVEALSNLAAILRSLGRAGQA
ncbi:MAG: tetratricopeptide repeat protein, partial [Roseiarcus sp.]